ncbi:nuclear transport factor 2 family protein [Blastomonas sp. UPD001]|uniref:YybH family protein n=1 Tax=Blastomonas sp. UPD001 TaxID=2217673 RepID=UPI000E350663|nr:nuclear transport factor 2 family protein [Blastomonas sp. UPD001]
MIEGKVIHLAGRRAAYFGGIVAIGLSLTAAHPGPHDAPRTPTSANPGAPVDAATPVGAVMAFHAALASGNINAASALLTEDVMIFESGGFESSRAEYASHHLEADAAFSAAVPRTLVSRSYGMQGDMAWVMSVETVTGAYRTRAINSRSVETMVLRQVNGQWRIAHIHWSSADIEPARP